MPPAPRSVGKVTTPAPPPPPPVPCAFTIGEDTCGQPAVAQLPIGYASNSAPMPLCALHAPRFLGAASPLT
jgi:hypothetical protein